MRIYITGASCAGVTTLGRTLASLLSLRHLDVDDFYWLPSTLHLQPSAHRMSAWL